MKNVYFIGVDVGTGSARAGVFDQLGKCLGKGKKDISIYEDVKNNIVEQSAEDIWISVCFAIQLAVKQSNINKKDIIGIGFDATCSLVVVGKNGGSLPVGVNGDLNRNIIVWMDHRATEQADRINSTKHKVLSYVGGIISPEMETPKLLWLKENNPDTYYAAEYFFDLTDYLTWRATEDLARSICTLSCKWTYLAHEQKWDKSYFHEIGLGDLAEENFKRIGQVVLEPGVSLGKGLTHKAAKDFGIKPGTSVGVGLIDAHAGGIGTIGSISKNGSPENRMAYVFGTSACTMSSSSEPIFVPGVWGPYYSAMVPGLWLTEGGQSAAGSAITQLLAYHPSSASASLLATAASQSLPDWLVSQVIALCETDSEAINIAGKVIIVPEFIGNRSPLADPDTRAIISGLSFENNLNSLLSFYIAGITGLGYGLRQIIDAQEAHGIKTNTIVISGGAGQSSLVRQLLADSTGVSVASPSSDEPILLGSAMLGAVSSGFYSSINESMQKMSQLGEVLIPSVGDLEVLHQQRYAKFKLLQSASRDS